LRGRNASWSQGKIAIRGPRPERDPERLGSKPEQSSRASRWTKHSRDPGPRILPALRDSWWATRRTKRKNDVKRNASSRIPQTRHPTASQRNSFGRTDEEDGGRPHRTDSHGSSIRGPSFDDSLEFEAERGGRPRTRAVSGRQKKRPEDRAFRGTVARKRKRRPIRERFQRERGSR
jgi:hypothetical protein